MGNIGNDRAAAMWKTFYTNHIFAEHCSIYLCFKKWK
jgi:hypothetical protein